MEQFARQIMKENESALTKDNPMLESLANMDPDLLDELKDMLPLRKRKQRNFVARAIRTAKNRTSARDSRERKKRKLEELERLNEARAVRIQELVSSRIHITL